MTHEPLEGISAGKKTTQSISTNEGVRNFVPVPEVPFIKMEISQVMQCGVKHDHDIRKQHCSSYRHIHLSKIMHGDNPNLTSVTKNKHTNIRHHTSGNSLGYC